MIVASVLVVVACSAHNDAYWSLRGYQSADARFASSLALSVIWTVLASAFIGVGLARDFAPLRFLAMALFGLTVLKVFLVDLSSLGGIYRILGFIGVGLVLLAVSFLYQRGRAEAFCHRGTETTELNFAVCSDGERAPFLLHARPLVLTVSVPTLINSVRSVSLWPNCLRGSAADQDSARPRVSGSTAHRPPRRETRGS